jgi:hypothetical protein
MRKPTPPVNTNVPTYRHMRRPLSSGTRIERKPKEAVWHAHPRHAIVRLRSLSAPGEEPSDILEHLTRLEP